MARDTDESVQILNFQVDFHIYSIQIYVFPLFINKKNFQEKYTFSITKVALTEICYLYIYIYIERERERKKERKKEKEREK